ncbi:hypothetical protein KA005_53185 [bacterium]|nr:hypothetical protein [bacterium]
MNKETYAGCECWKMVLIPGLYPDVPEGMEGKLKHHPLCDKRPAAKKYVKLIHNGSSVIETAESIGNSIDAILDGAESGDKYELEVVEMRPDVYGLIPEFEGW